MSASQIILGIVMLLTSLALVAIVLLQEGRQAGLSGAIAGGADSFLGKNKSKTVEQKLVKITKVLAVLFFIISIVATLLVFFLK
ncbi:MAG: preprotein translocase subunit SecG [Clostridia bacterium]|nr:preprotein translocase subunit SecG [Clostridia bacterium]